MADPQPQPRRARWRGVVMVCLLAWAGLAFTVTLAQVLERVRQPPDVRVVVDWRLGERRSLSLRDFLHTMAVSLPPDQVVAFSSETNDFNQRFFLTLWSAYFLPQQRVILLPGTVTEPNLNAVPADYVVTYNHRLDEHPRLQQVAEHPSGALYRVVPLAPAAPVGGSL